MNTATKFAIEKAGGAKALGKALGISHQAIGQWRQVPPLRVIQIETITGVHRSDLRPDLYPPEAHQTTKATHERAGAGEAR